MKKTNKTVFGICLALFLFISGVPATDNQATAPVVGNASTIEPIMVASCYDSDGGKQFYTKGYVTEYGVTSSDYCASSEKLVELYCDNGEMEKDTYRCDGECVDGACVGVACTMDAKVCPDGSVVGRIAPDCEFAPCPTSGLSLYAYTEKTEYQVGDEAKIIAKLSANKWDLSNAVVKAKVEKPNGETETIKFSQTYCMGTDCACPSCMEGAYCPPCSCSPYTSCQYEADFDVRNEGSYYINAYAELDNERADSYAKFWAYRSSNTKNVKLDQKFDLVAGDSAVVVDYGDMRITLSGIIQYRCAGSGSTSPSVSGEAMPRCIGSSPEATILVRGPITYYKTGVTISSDIAYTETQLNLQEGETGMAFGAEISLVDLSNNEATFVVSAGDDGDNVDVKVVPTTRNIELGETAEYTIKIKDRHTTNSGRLYSYSIYVSELPFGLSYQTQVTLSAGETIEIPLYVDTSIIGTTVYSEAATSNVRAGTATAVSATSGVIAPTISQDVAVEKVQIAPEYIGNGRAYNFKVLVYGDSGSDAVAYAVLNVLYSPPPPPPYDKVEIELAQGWNLITLPGEGRLESGTCGNTKEMYAFVYLNGEGRYLTLDEASARYGDSWVEDYLRTHAYWVYSYDSCYMYFDLQSATSLNDIELDVGWNFVPVTQDMEGNTLGGIGGECDFDKAYYWNAKSQNWDRLTESDAFTGDMLYNGFVAKVKNSCGFGWGAIIAPPPLPA